MKVPLEKECRPVVGPVRSGWRIHKILFLDVPDSSCEDCKKKLCRRNVIGLDSTEICRRDVRDWRVTDSQSYKRPGRLLAAVVELMRVGQIQFETRLKRVRALNEAQSVCKLLERTNRLARGRHTEWSVRHSRGRRRA